MQWITVICQPKAPLWEQPGPRVGPISSQLMVWLLLRQLCPLIKHSWKEPYPRTLNLNKENIRSEITPFLLMNRTNRTFWDRELLEMFLEVIIATRKTNLMSPLKWCSSKIKVWKKIFRNIEDVSARNPEAATRKILRNRQSLHVENNSFIWRGKGIYNCYGTDGRRTLQNSSKWLWA